MINHWFAWYHRVLQLQTYRIIQSSVVVTVVLLQTPRLPVNSSFWCALQPYHLSVPLSRAAFPPFYTRFLAFHPFYAQLCISSSLSLVPWHIECYLRALLKHSVWWKLYRARTSISPYFFPSSSSLSLSLPKFILYSKFLISRRL